MPKQKATLPDLLQVVHSESASWRSAVDLRRHGMPTEVARQEMCRVETDITAYYLGVRMVEHLYLTCKGFGKSALSELLESKEDKYRVYDDMKTCKEKFASDLDATDTRKAVDQTPLKVKEG